MANYPEHEKLKLVSEKSQACGEFLEWLNSTCGLVLCRETSEVERDEMEEYGEGVRESYAPARITTNNLLAEFYGINQQKLEKEKEAMLAELRKANA